MEEKVKVFTLQIALDREQVENCIGWSIVIGELDPVVGALVENAILNHSLSIPDGIWQVMATPDQEKEVQMALASVWPDNA